MVEKRLRKRWKQMKKSWKNFKLDSNKVYAFIGKVTVVILFNAVMTAMFVYGFLQNTVYQEEEMNFWGYFRVITGTLIITIAGIIVLVKWHKEIDSETTWIYGIYIVLQIILSLFVLIKLELFWLVH